MNRVLVVGGGIGGLCATIALRKQGIEVDVVEINPRWDVYGVGIIQPGNALRALDILGLAERCVAEGFPMKGSRQHHADGELIAEMDFPPPTGTTATLPPQNGITRPRLHNILTSAVLASGADVRTGVTVSRSDADRRLPSSRPSRTGGVGRYDLVVGADGVNSLVRSMVFGPELKPEYSGQVVWRYNLPRYGDIDRIWMYAGSFGKAGLVPLAPDLMYLLLVEKAPDELPPDAELANVLRERLAEYGGPIAEIRDQITDPERVVLRRIETILVPVPWYRGRVVLIGDAAHATSPHVGQGAAQAIEDGIVLAEEIVKRRSRGRCARPFHGATLRALQGDPRGLAADREVGAGELPPPRVRGRRHGRHERRGGSPVSFADRHLRGRRHGSSRPGPRIRRGRRPRRRRVAVDAGSVRSMDGRPALASRASPKATNPRATTTASSRPSLRDR